MEGIQRLRTMDKSEIKIAYFSMEIGFDGDIPTYSGGLGILAGDTLRSCADLEVPICGVTLVSNKGYFIQQFDKDFNQIEAPNNWKIGDFLEPLKATVTVPISGRTVTVKAWKYDLPGITGHKVPIFFLDTDCEENSEEDRKITYYLYGGDRRYRLFQEVVLGIGGYKMLKKLGFYDIEKFHMNEGHSALLTVELRKDLVSDSSWDIFEAEVTTKVQNRCVFTTHTPVPAGHDKFSKDLVNEVIGSYLTKHELDLLCPDGEMNMTLLALNNSKYINGVAKKHGEVSREMFPGYKIESITNGVHSSFWCSDALAVLFDKYLKDWRKDPFTIRNAFSIPPQEILEAHTENKKKLITYINEKYDSGMEAGVFTLGFARRITAYKRPFMFFEDMERLKKISEKSGKIQVVFAGKAHPNDTDGKRIIRDIKLSITKLSPFMKLVFLDNYNINLAKTIVAGVDIWLNNPQPPKEASGTSGMKASINGIPNLSVLDGWWLEGHVENVTGWSIGDREALYQNIEVEQKTELNDLYGKLEKIIIPTYYNKKEDWMRIMQNCIAFNGSFFNTHRMVYQYVASAYFD